MCFFRLPAGRKPGIGHLGEGRNDPDLDYSKNTRDTLNFEARSPSHGQCPQSGLSTGQHLLQSEQPVDKQDGKETDPGAV